MIEPHTTDRVKLFNSSANCCDDVWLVITSDDVTHNL